MEILKKKKGFTLIELMIVLAIVAILAVVLVPKSQIFKNNSKNAGVTTNVNTVRGYLETKITDGTGTNSYLDVTELGTALKSAFGLGSSYIPASTSTTDALVNPFDKKSASISVGTNGSDVSTAKVSSGYLTSNNKGKVIVEVCKVNNIISGYIVYGIDNGGSATTVFRVK